ncbi:cyanase [Mycolicibacterium houstonense]|uniref:cyanase n=1 Tax=Mycolicibacterium houstonense TaxID=146021 RepID=UPI00082BEB17|nr:cyanase [Mycolicibacterium houstonense]MCV7065966.1 cyanase [Mycolicibacterium farcinogenes]
MTYAPGTTEIEDRRIETGIGWQAIADHIDRPLVWTVAALLGSHPVPQQEASAVGELLGLSNETVAALQRQPYRTSDPSLSTDPTIYRFVELINVYGPAFKALIHEEFGDGIMSAINCNVSFARRQHPDGDRVVVTIDGKFLPYQW